MIDLNLVEQSFATMRTRSESMFGGAMITEADLACCQSCGCAEIDTLAAERKEDEPEGKLVGYVFYHNQDTEGCLEGGDLHLAYGVLDETEVTTEQVGHLIAECLREHGFTVEWNGSVKTRICVKSPDVTA